MKWSCTHIHRYAHQFVLSSRRVTFPCTRLLLLLSFGGMPSDSGTAWRDLKKHHERAYKKTFPNYLTVHDIGQALERLNIRWGAGAGWMRAWR